MNDEIYLSIKLLSSWFLRRGSYPHVPHYLTLNSSICNSPILRQWRCVIQQESC